MNLRFKTKHFLTGTELSKQEMSDLLTTAELLREQRRNGFRRDDLRGQHVALLFEKPSLRTRVSFTVAVQELGGSAVGLDSMGRKKEDPEDTIRVIGAYCHAIMVRTHAHNILERMVRKSQIPIVNGLSDSHHPCQVLADILTLKQRYGETKGLKLAYVGDGNNMLHSLMLLCPTMGIDVSYACPTGYGPNSLIVRQASKRARDGGSTIQAHATPEEAVTGAAAIYTDVWTSMGFEQEETDRDRAFSSYQVNERLYALAAPRAAIMHCMPLIRDKEITAGLVEHENSVIFQQAENRMHVQKAILIGLIGRG